MEKPESGPESEDLLSLEAAYQRRVLRLMVLIGSPFILGYAVVLGLLSAPWYTLGLYLLSAVIMAAGSAVLMRPMPPRRFFLLHRAVSVGYISALLTVQVLSIAVLQRLEFAPWILLYPSLAFLVMSGVDGLVIVALCGAAFFVPLFLGTPAPFGPEGILAIKMNLVLVFVLVSASTFFINRTRRRFLAVMVEREQEAVRMREAAESASRAKSEFLANVSHELRTPLNHVIGFTDLLREMARDKGDETAVEYLTDLLTSGRHLQHLVNDALDLSGIESGRLPLVLTTVDPVTLLQRAAMLAGARAKEKVIAIAVEPGVPAAPLQMDAGRITQVLVNLVSNAVSFTPAGGHVRLGCAYLDAATPRGPAMLFSVSDTGVGIAHEDLHLLFQRFSRLGRDPPGSGTGLGIGLALSRELVRRHGGEIWAESEGEGKGSTFHFTIPVPLSPRDDAPPLSRS